MMAKDHDNHAEEVSSIDKDSEARPKLAHVDRAASILGDEPIDLTEEESRRICRKIDKVILPILVWVYFLQILDKSVLGYGAVLGLRTDTGLTGDQYSYVSSVSAMAQLGWQPFSSYLIIKVPHRHLMPALVSLLASRRKPSRDIVANSHRYWGGVLRRHSWPCATTLLV